MSGSAIPEAGYEDRVMSAAEETPYPPCSPYSPWSLTVPVAMGYIPLGMVFGFLFVQAGGSWWLATLSSLLIYAGAAQFMMVPMLAAGMPLGSIAIATLVLNLRHVFYGFSLLGRFPKRGWSRAYLVFALTDETYSVLTTLPAETPPRVMTVLAALNHGWWVLGTLLGALLGTHARVPLTGLDFVLVALFVVLAVEQWRSRASALPLWVALVAYAFAFWALPKHALVIAIALCVGAAVVWKPERAEGKPDSEGASA